MSPQRFSAKRDRDCYVCQEIPTHNNLAGLEPLRIKDRDSTHNKERARENERDRARERKERPLSTILSTVWKYIPETHGRLPRSAGAAEGGESLLLPALNGNRFIVRLPFVRVQAIEPASTHHNFHL